MIANIPHTSQEKAMWYLLSRPWVRASYWSLPHHCSLIPLSRRSSLHHSHRHSQLARQSYSPPHRYTRSSYCRYYLWSHPTQCSQETHPLLLPIIGPSPGVQLYSASSTRDKRQVVILIYSKLGTYLLISDSRLPLIFPEALRALNSLLDQSFSGSFLASQLWARLLLLDLVDQLLFFKLDTPGSEQLLVFFTLPLVSILVFEYFVHDGQGQGLWACFWDLALGFLVEIILIEKSQQSWLRRLCFLLERNRRFFNLVG